jgi:hypothetical protein
MLGITSNAAGNLHDEKTSFGIVHELSPNASWLVPDYRVELAIDGWTATTARCKVAKEAGCVVNPPRAGYGLITLTLRLGLLLRVAK